MQMLYFKPLWAVLIRSLLIIAFLMPSVSFAWYGGRHHGHYGHGYRHSGHYGYYGYRKYGGHSYYPRKYYRRRYYGYSYRRHNNYSKSYFNTVPVYSQFNNESNGNQYSSSENNGINSLAWQTLAEGQYRAALNSFAGEAQSHPNSGVPKAGYALATASGGNLERGIWAMRRAFRIDPNSLHYIQLDEKGHLLIDNLIAQYSSQKNDTDAGQSFMISALHYLKHDYDAAKKSITNAQQYGDESSSSTNLQSLVDMQLIDQNY